MREVEIHENDANQRLDRFLNKYLPLAATSYLQKMIRKKRIKVNKKKAEPDQELQLGDKIQLYIYEEELEQFEKKVKTSKAQVQLSYVFDGPDYSIIDKPKALLSHAAKKSNYGKNVVDAFVDDLIAKEEYMPRREKSFRPSIVNRLDFNTEGLIIGVKNHKAAMTLNEARADGSIKKYYRAVCYGRIDENIEIDLNLVRKGKNVEVVDSNDEGKRSITRVRPIMGTDQWTYVDIELETGRFHQIRVHMASIGHPLVGDQGFDQKRREVEGVHSQMLIAYKLEFGNLGIEDWNNKTYCSQRLEAFEKKIEKVNERLGGKNDDKNITRRR